MLPTLAPSMLLPRVRPIESGFPFNHPRVSYYYLARNAIYGLARHFRLSGCEVLFPAYFHGVELEAVLAAGVRPSFYPVHTGMQVDPDEIVARMTTSTRAVYLIHYLGFPGPIREIATACRDRGIFLIEDCALALLSRAGHDGALGTFGDAAVFCLYKTLPVPNGGALVLAQNAGPAPPRSSPPLRVAVASIAASLAAHYALRQRLGPERVIRSLTALGRRVPHWVGGERVEVGSQFFEAKHVDVAMSRLVRPILSRQRFSEIAARRRRNFSFLLERLGDLSPPVWSRLPSGVCPLFYPLQTREKQALMESLSTRGIETVDFWSLGHRSVTAGAFPEVDQLRRSIVELPCHQDLSLEVMGDIVKALYQYRAFL